MSTIPQFDSYQSDHNPNLLDEFSSKLSNQLNLFETITDSPELRQALTHAELIISRIRAYYNVTQVNCRQAVQLVVRVFRPDRTTKAILIEQQMTAGEIANLLIEKNFLKPSTSLALVEKVPALKIERVFEEHDNVAECILAWPTKSQNMIFFEERPDHFGFIESPTTWLGKEFATKHMYNNSESIQNMLNNIDNNNLPEWRDYLYIRKPGDKTWSRRLCVLRRSGLYTSNKNKKSSSPTNLIRILILDNSLKLYTTTGGWSRLRAPTPHGFTFKPYSTQDASSTHVFCFCATDEKALCHWMCQLRIAKYGRKLLTDYHTAMIRVQRLIAIRTNSTSFPGSQVKRKSSFDYPPNSYLSSPSNLVPTASSTSLLVSNSSPSVFPRRDLQHLVIDHKSYSKSYMPNECNQIDLMHQYHPSKHGPNMTQSNVSGNISLNYSSNQHSFKSTNQNQLINSNQSFFSSPNKKKIMPSSNTLYLLNENKTSL